ncbi:hypothetical protein R1flu_012489 [Riccia fluitans]|uniref:Uncharacterized protein n=1 Tax=Riccia fluitans TaxID=41844 RepID=A0ABD1ZE43_9MARC
MLPDSRNPPAHQLLAVEEDDDVSEEAPQNGTALVYKEHSEDVGRAKLQEQGGCAKGVKAAFEVGAAQISVSRLVSAIRKYGLGRLKLKVNLYLHLVWTGAASELLGCKGVRIRN